jgi:hypothetical protein
VAFFVAFAAVVLLMSGALVTTTRNGDSIPSWPATELLPGSIFEFSHRMAAALIGIASLGLAIFASINKSVTKGFKVLVWVTFVAVLIQATLGGLRVLAVEANYFFMRARYLAIIHACLGQLIFCCMVSVALFTTEGWNRPVADRSLPRGFVLLTSQTTLFLLLQLLFGAWFRHSQTGIEYHMWGAGVVSIMILASGIRGLLHHREDLNLAGPSATILVMLLAQVTMGIVSYFIVSDRRFVYSMDAPPMYIALICVHVVVGALLLANAVILTLRAFRGSEMLEAVPMQIKAGSELAVEGA